MFMPSWNSSWYGNDSSTPSSHDSTFADAPPYSASHGGSSSSHHGGNFKQYDPALVQQLLSMLVGPGAFHPGSTAQGSRPSPPMGAPQPRQSVPLANLVASVSSPVTWRQTTKVAECIDAIRQKEREFDHDFSVDNIKAEMLQLATLPQTIKRLAREHKDAKERLVELQTLEPHFDECIDIRAKNYQATHSGKRQRLTPLERDLANAKKGAEEEDDAAFVAPETPPAQVA